MTVSATQAPVRVVLFSNNSDTREAVRMAVGRRAGSGLPVIDWVEVATQWAVEKELQNGNVDLVIADGEAQPVGGLGLCRQFKNEIFQCPPFLVLTGRPEDAWLAAWSQADAALPQPLDPVAVAAAVEELMVPWLAAKGPRRTDALRS